MPRRKKRTTRKKREKLIDEKIAELSAVASEMTKAECVGSFFEPTSDTTTTVDTDDIEITDDAPLEEKINNVKRLMMFGEQIDSDGNAIAPEEKKVKFTIFITQYENHPAEVVFGGTVEPTPKLINVACSRDIWLGLRRWQVERKASDRKLKEQANV